MAPHGGGSVSAAMLCNEASLEAAHNVSLVPGASSGSIAGPHDLALV